MATRQDQAKASSLIACWWLNKVEVNYHVTKKEK